MILELELHGLQFGNKGGCTGTDVPCTLSNMPETPISYRVFTAVQTHVEWYWYKARFAECIPCAVTKVRANLMVDLKVNHCRGSYAQALVTSLLVVEPCDVI